MRVRINWSTHGEIHKSSTFGVPPDNEKRIRQMLENLIKGSIVRVGDTFTVSEEEA